MITDTVREQIAADIGELATLVRAGPSVARELIPGERRRVTVVFLDLHGFTSLSERLDHEVLARVVHGVMTVLRRVIESHGGQIDKFEGDLVMALFGALTTREHDTAQAVACALKMLTSLVDVNTVLRPAGIELSARIGVNMGSVTVAPDPSGHVTVMGDVVNTAARMESSAQLNTVQVTGSVHDACGDLFAWEDLGERQLKGKSESVRAWRPLGPGPAVRARWERASRLPASSLVGREQVLELLQDRLVRSTRQPVQWVGLCGDRGIGKSRLIHEFLKRQGDGIACLRGHAVAVASPPWCAWSAALLRWSGVAVAGEEAAIALEQRLRALPTSQWTATLVELLPYLRSLVGGSGSQQASDEQARRFRTVEALTTLVRALPRPLVLVIEDTHWLDPSSHEVLERIVAQPEEQLLVITSFRIERDDGSVEPPHSGREDVRLLPLDDQACGALLSQLLGEMAPGTAAHFQKAAGGNPFFLEELVLDAIESGRVFDGEQGWKVVTSIVSVPGTVEDASRARIDRLGTALREVLQRAAVVGAEFPMAALERVSQRAGASLSQDQMAELEARGFFVRDAATGLWRFKHAITRSVAYATLLRHNRAVLHRLSAQLMEEGSVTDALASIVAFHWENANDHHRASKWALKALEYFRQHHHPEQGLQWAEKLEAWLGEPTTPAEAEQLGQVVSAAEEFARWLLRPEVRARQIERLRDIARRFGLSTTEGRVLLASARLAHDSGRFVEAGESYRSAILQFERANATRLMGGAWLSLGVLLNDLASFEEAIKAFEAARVCVAGSPSEEALVLSNFASAHVHRGEPAAARRLFDEADRKLAESPNLRVEGISNVLRAPLDIDQEDLVGAVDRYERAVRCASEAGLLYTLSSAKAALASAQGLAGRLEDAAATAESWMRVDRRWANPYVKVALHAFVASAKLACRDVLTARELIQSVKSTFNPGAVPSLYDGLCEAVFGRCVLGPAADVEAACASYDRARAAIGHTRLRPSSFLARDFRLLRQELLATGVASQALLLPSHWTVTD